MGIQIETIATVRKAIQIIVRPITRKGTHKRYGYTEYTIVFDNGTDKKIGLHEGCMNINLRDIKKVHGNIEVVKNKAMNYNW